MDTTLPLMPKPSIKGATWERQLGVALSLWLTQGARSDLFARNVLSGGRFTRAMLGNTERGQAGDLAAAHPLAFRFLDAFVVEAKHHKDLKLAQWLLFNNKAFLNTVFDKTFKEANEDDKYALVIAKEDYLPPLLLTSQEVGIAIIASCWVERPGWRIKHHLMHGGQFACKWHDFLDLVDPDKLLKALECC